MPTRKLLLLLVAGLLLAPALPALAARGHVGIVATPRMLELDPGARAVLRITSPEPPVLTASVGRVEGIRALGNGVYEATYFPPAETYPQVAIISATVSNGFGWLPLPLAGTGDVAVKTDPNGTATLVIGKERYGPAQADASGRASIRVVVPPGVRYAMHGSKRLSLNTPEVPHVYVTIDRSSVPADTSANALVRAFAVTPDGKPRRGAPLHLTTTNGQLSAVREVEAGVFEARWALAPGAAGTAAVEAKLSDDAAPAVRGTVLRESSTPRKIKLEVDRPSVVAGEGTLDFAVSIEDGAGNPVDDATPRATVSFGTFLGWTRGAPGHWMGRISIPQRLEGSTKLDITAAAGEVVAQRSIQVVPGPTADLTIDPPSTDLAGKPTASFAVTAVDRFGNPTDDAGLKVTAALGEVEPPVREGPGLYRVVYRPPPDPAEHSKDELKVSTGSVERISRVRFQRASTSSLLEVTPKAGVAGTSDAFGPLAGADASLWTTLGAEEFGLTFDAAWFQLSRSKTLLAGSLAFKSTTHYVPIMLEPSWRTGLGGGWRLWASIGGGASYVQSTSNLTGAAPLTQSTWVPVGTAALSIGARLGPGFPFMELRGSYVGDPKLANLSGSFFPFFLSAGYRFDAL